jgi:hypothetical protein
MEKRMFSTHKSHWNTTVLAAVTAILSLALVSCSEEQQNKLSRLGVTWLEGDYRVTYADGSHVKSWVVEDGKVTSEPQKGYYYFWANVDGKKVYVQTPIERTYIEGMK